MIENYIWNSVYFKMINMNRLLSKNFWSFAEPKQTKDNSKESFGFLTVCWIIMAIALFLYVNVPDARIPASIFVFMALASGIAVLASEMDSKKSGFDFVVLGHEWKKAAFLGICFGIFFIFLGGQSIVEAFSVNVLIENNFLNNLFFVGIAAPIFEELFFRLPMLYAFPFLLGFIGLPKGLSFILGIIGSSFGWALYHVSVLGSNPESLLLIFFIGLIYGVINVYVLRSVMFSFGAHLSNNVLVVLLRSGLNAII
jgi:membrane protease YdiL (CAAX protease family)